MIPVNELPLNLKNYFPMNVELLIWMKKNSSIYSNVLIAISLEIVVTLLIRVLKRFSMKNSMMIFSSVVIIVTFPQMMSGSHGHTTAKSKQLLLYRRLIPHINWMKLLELAVQLVGFAMVLKVMMLLKENMEKTKALCRIKNLKSPISNANSVGGGS